MQPRVVIGGTKSGVGKTTIAVGLMEALTQAGFDVQPYKVGPDYIDPGFHTLVTGRAGRNLDSYFLSSAGLREVWQRGARAADISIIEGVMGLFDGKNGQDEVGSTAHTAQILKAPVVLVVDVQKMARSAAALVKGYKEFAPDLKLGGVILNRVGSKGHYQVVKRAVEGETGVPVIGRLPRREELKLPERHLGLVPVKENRELEEFVVQLGDLIGKYIDLDQLMSLAKEVPRLKTEEENLFKVSRNYDLDLGVAYDEAFNFYYQTNLDLLADRGVNLKYFSPLKDNFLPEVDGLYIGGGFPESFLADLAANQKLKEDIYRQVNNGLPTYAECGGLMYLTEEIKNKKGESFPMVGLIPGRVEMTDKLQAMGYLKAKACTDNLLLKQGAKIKGHEFHYSRLVSTEEKLPSAYWVGEEKAGVKIKNLLASYIHLYFGSRPEVVDNFLENCQRS